MNVGRYEILKEVGRGAMGVVYQARDPNLDIVVALKVLRPDRLSSEPFVHRFLAEAKVLGRLDHPNIVRVYNVDRSGDTVFIAMEFIEGESLTDLMKQRRFSAEEIAAFGATAAEALDYAHQKMVVHRDVKPSNILFRQDGRLKITDFGIAHIEDPTAQEQTQAGEILGTPAYMSPEQVLSRHVDGRSDIFSLGIILYELACGKRPFSGEGINAIFSAITDEDPAPLASCCQLPKPYCEIIMRCLRKAPEERYRNGRELAAALRGLSRTEIAPKLGKPQVPRRPLVYGGVALLVLAGSAIGFYLHHPKPQGPEKAAPAAAPAVQPARLGWLRVETTPQGAEIFIDGALKGTAPARLDLSPGKHEVRLTLPRHLDWEAQVDLKQETETPLVVKLVPSEGG